MECPKCAGPVRVKDNCHVTNTNRIFRKRECKNCGYIFHTIEYIARVDENFKREWKNNYRWQDE